MGNSTPPAKCNAQELEITCLHNRILAQTQVALPQTGFTILIHVYSICHAKKASSFPMMRNL
jgi:hypothetical protein